jgi:hypothetical protein
MSDEATATPATPAPEAAAPETPPAPPTEAQLVAKAHVAIMHLHTQAVLLSQLVESRDAESQADSIAAAKLVVKALRDVANKACEAAGM